MPEGKNHNIERSHSKKMVKDHMWNRQLLLGQLNKYTRFWSIVSNRGTHLAQSFLKQKYVCKILTTCSVEMDTILAISRTFTFGSFKTISWILLIISGVVILFGRPWLGIVFVLVRSQQNSAVNYFWTIPYYGAESE